MTSPGNLPQYLKPTPGPSIEEKFGEGEAYSAGRGPCWPLFAPRCVDGHDPQGHSSGQGVPARRHVLKNVNPVGYNHESHPTGWLDWDWLAGPTGLEPATSGVTGPYLPRLAPTGPKNCRENLGWFTVSLGGSWGLSAPVPAQFPHIPGSNGLTATGLHRVRGGQRQLPSGQLRVRDTPSQGRRRNEAPGGPSKDPSGQVRAADAGQRWSCR